MIYSSLLVKFILSARLRNNLCRSEVLLFHEFTNIVSILYFIYIEFILLLYTFVVISLARHKEQNVLPDVLPALTFESAVGDLWSVCLGADILIPFP